MQTNKLKKIKIFDTWLFEFSKYLQKYENHLHTFSENITMEKRLTTRKR